MRNTLAIRTVQNNKALLYIAMVSCLFFIPKLVWAAPDWSECMVTSGITTIPADQATQDFTISPALTDITQAFLLVKTSGPSGIAGADDHLVSGYIKNASTLTFERGAAPSIAAQVSYSVVECFNDEFVVQRGAITIASGELANGATINAVTESKSMVIVSSRSNDTSENEATGLATGRLSDSTTVVVRRAGTPPIATTVRFEVVEFTAASNVGVQTGSVDLTSGNASASDTINEIDPDYSWIYCSWDATNNGLQQASLGCEITNATTITVHRHAASAFTNKIRYYVVEFPPASVIGIQAGNESNNPGSNDNTKYNHDITITEITDTSKAFPYVTNTTQGTDNNFPRNQWITYFEDETTLRTTFWRGAGADNTSDDNEKYWQVVEFPMKVPTVPTITSAENQDRNPDLYSSAYIGQGDHTLSDWKVVTTNDCDAGTMVWRSLDNANNKTFIAVNNTAGTFVGVLSGQTKLAAETTYYACVQHANDGGDSGWSAGVAFNTNALPVASSVLTDAGAETFIISPGTTQNAVITATITDQDSCQDVESVTAKFFRTSKGAPGLNDNNFRYSVTCAEDEGTCVDGADTSATYTCTIPVQYYAEPTDASSPDPADNWTALVKPIDGSGNGAVDADTIELSTVASVSTTASINFSAFDLGTDSGAVNEIVTVTNIGNVNVDINASTFGVEIDDGKSLSCTLGTIDDNKMKYHTAGFTYSSGGTSMSSTPDEINMNIGKSTGGTSSANLYFGLGIPATGVGGTCTGSVVLSAVSDSAVD